jgi:hypothetical protein
MLLCCHRNGVRENRFRLKNNILLGNILKEWSIFPFMVGRIDIGMYIKINY